MITSCAWYVPSWSIELQMYITGEYVHVERSDNLRTDKQMLPLPHADQIYYLSLSNKFQINKTTWKTTF